MILCVLDCNNYSVVGDRVVFVYSYLFCAHADTIQDTADELIDLNVYSCNNIASLFKTYKHELFENICNQLLSK